MTIDDEVVRCPFCGYRAAEGQGQYLLLLHMEQFHSEGPSPFIARDGDGEPPHAATGDQNGGDDDEEGYDDGEYAVCPACEEIMLPEELDDHLELHQEEYDADAQLDATADAIQTGDSPSEPVSRGATPSTRHEQPNRSHTSSKHASSRQESAIQGWRNLLNMPGSRHHHHHHHASQAPAEDERSSADGSRPRKRLGKNELGKYAHEKQMPDWLVAHLTKGGQEVGVNVVPVLQQLLQQSPTTRHAYLCHPCVQHVSKLKREGGFCGYRNIQMLASYIIGTGAEGARHFAGGRIPSIFQIQDSIEEAWDRGINAQGRVETGGIRGTRKYIGTPEAQAMLVGLQVPCEAQGFKDREPGRSEELLMRDVERYFQSAAFDPADKVRCTRLPPVYFQHAGHSMTIVGFERLKSGQANLLVFDPMFHDSSSVANLVGRVFKHRAPELLLKPYRRGNKYLKKYREFEVLRLRPPPEVYLQN